MINSVVIGNLGRSAEIKDAKGTPVVSFSVASTDGYGDKKTTTWVRVSFFGQRATKVAEYLQKGTQVAVRGTITMREYQSKGETKSALEMRADDIKLLGSRSDNATSGARAVTQAASKDPDWMGDDSFNPDDF